MKNVLKKHAFFFTTLLRLLDPAVLIAFTWLFYHFAWFDSYELTKVLSIYCGILVLIVFSFFGLYKSWRVQILGNEIKTLAVSWVTVLLLFHTFIFLLANDEQLAVLLPYGLFSTKGFCLWALSVFSGNVCVRMLVRLFLRFIRKNGWNQRSAIIAGAGEVGINLTKYLQQTGTLGIKVIGFFDDNKQIDQPIVIGNDETIPVLGILKDSIPYAINNKVDIVIITLPMRAAEKINELVWQLGLQGVNVMMAPDLFTFGLQKTKLIHIGETPVMLFNLFPSWKRGFDIIFSTIALILFSPFMVLIPFLIKKEDGGNIFYGHPRIREQGKIFKCLKFRTMHMDADKRLADLLDSNPDLAREWEKNYKLKDDPRITRIGKFLRKTSLDELPQFINVLKGEMSIVGARPVVKDELDKYYNTCALAYCSMKPGVTGPWQAGKRNNIEDYSERVNLDRLYFLHANIWLDLKIILKTIFKIITGCKGAY
ncbi:MAG: sugar transferase [Desulfobacterium sp.]